MNSDDPAFAGDPQTQSVFTSSPRIAARDGLPVYREVGGELERADVELTVSIEVGRVRMRLADLLQLGEGAVIELDKMANDPVDIVVNDQLVARGEVVIYNDKFAVRVTQVLAAGKGD